jgi:hypothetical protein
MNNFPKSNKPKIELKHGKNIFEVRKNSENSVEVGNPIWTTFFYYNFFQISMDFELFKRFRVKAGLTEMCSHRLIATPIANPPEHGNLRCLYYDLVDMHKLSHRIQEVMEFQRWLNVKLNWKNFEVLNSESPPETNTSRSQWFLSIFTLP